MVLGYEDYRIEAETLIERLKMFLNSKPAPDGEDFSDVYDHIDQIVLQRHMDELNFFLYTKKRREAEQCMLNMIDLIR